MDMERRAWFKYRALAYLFIVAIAIYGAWRAEQAMNVVAEESARVSILACQAVGEDRVVIANMTRTIIEQGRALDEELDKTREQVRAEALRVIQRTLEQPPSCVEQKIPNVVGRWHIHVNDPVRRWHFHFGENGHENKGENKN